MTSFLQKLGVPLPLVQAPMAGTSTAELAAAVGRQGALGSIAVGAMNAATAQTAIADVRRVWSGPLNVNVFAHRPAMPDRMREDVWLGALEPVFRRYAAAPPAHLREIYTSFVADTDMQDVLLEARPAVVSLHFGLPHADLIARLKAAGILVLASVTNIGEGRAAVAAGVDAVVAQGFEAGGHRGVFDPSAPDSELGTLALTRLLVRELAVPVIAAGGLMDGAGIAAALALGATAAQLGTAFVGCPESNADAYHRAALFGPGANHTLMTRVISGRPARCLPNLFTGLAAGDLAGLVPPDYPTTYDAGKALAGAAKAKGEGGFGAHWAGQGAPLARVMPAEDLVATLAAELKDAQARML